MDDALQMSMLDSKADVDKQIQSLLQIQLFALAVFRQRNTANQFHHKIGPSGFRCARIQNMCDVAVVHHGQGLSFCFKPTNDLPGIHAGLNDF